MPQFESDFTDAYTYTDESLLNEIRRVAARNPGASMASGAFEQVSQRVSASTIRRRFGSWQSALIKAGLPHLYGGRKVSEKMRDQPAKRLTKDDLIRDMHRVSALVGKGFLTVSDFNAHSISSVEAVRRRFGSWASALAQAGIPRSEGANRNWSNDECLGNLAVVWTHFGRPPAYREMSSPPSVISGKAYETRWGTWRKALRAFVAWADAESDSAFDPSQLPVAVGRAEEYPQQIGPRLRFRVFRRDRFGCVACGRSPATDPKIVLHTEYLVPVALGGKATMGNLQALCEGCNSDMGKFPCSRHRWLPEALNEVGLYSENGL